MKHNQNGFGLVELVLVIAVLAAIGLGAFMLYTKDSEDAVKQGDQVQQQAEDLSEDNDQRNDALEKATELDDSLN